MLKENKPPCDSWHCLRGYFKVRGVSVYLQPPVDKDLINSLWRSSPCPSVTCSVTLGKSLCLSPVGERVTGSVDQDGLQVSVNIIKCALKMSNTLEILKALDEHLRSFCRNPEKTKCLNTLSQPKSTVCTAWRGSAGSFPRLSVAIGFGVIYASCLLKRGMSQHGRACGFASWSGVSPAPGPLSPSTGMSLCICIPASKAKSHMAVQLWQ